MTYKLDPSDFIVLWSILNYSYDIKTSMGKFLRSTEVICHLGIFLSKCNLLFRRLYC